ncbi:hypothetical protein HYH02_008183 [Chlamydomonas schloesseri]|uniref:Uncharacterized protein n=1 Tax=Chlamydomonas schloesseri TaxID=2026947 RepID=A0A835WH26_9CHLO|nr:hypothetical protein HYH02_008183 [Chlamydomonas schloesseri]|eukprot:KAG2447031.1 hypothetical protein HYH02_008183 [Chlamydomonas schloesseri]
MNLQLTPNAVYSLQCDLASSAPADSTYTEVYMATSVGGTYKGVLYRNNNPSQLDALTQRVARDAAQEAGDIVSLRNDLAALNATVQAQASQIASATQQIELLKSRMAAAEAQDRVLQGDVNGLRGLLKPDPDGSISPRRVCFGDACLVDNDGHSIAVTNRNGQVTVLIIRTNMPGGMTLHMPNGCSRISWGDDLAWHIGPEGTDCKAGWTLRVPTWKRYAWFPDGGTNFET